jgi:AAA+ superfamily predicted ATPase
MAVTRKGNTIRMTAAADAVTGKFKVQAVELVHTAAATASFGDSADFVHENLATTASVLADRAMYPCGIFMDGIKAVALSAGTLVVHVE